MKAQVYILHISAKCQPMYQFDTYFQQSVVVLTIVLPPVKVWVSFQFNITSGAGVRWENFHKPVDVDDDFTVLHCIIMLIVDIILYGLITWYVDAVKPGRYGVAKPFYFPFTVRMEMTSNSLH